jgi:hypothetical protein
MAARRIIVASYPDGAMAEGIAAELLRVGLEASVVYKGERAWQVLVPERQERDARKSIEGVGYMMCGRRTRPTMGSLRDIPLPPNIPRPEMWDAGAVVRAVKDGFTFMIPFVPGESLFSQNAYWIAGEQYGASGLTVGPEHTPEIEVMEDGWIRAMTFFRPEMVPKRAWIGPPSEFGVIAVNVEIDPDTIDWKSLNRGHQIRG